MRHLMHITSDQDKQVQAAMDRYIQMVADQNEQDRVVRAAQCKLAGHTYPDTGNLCAVCGRDPIALMNEVTAHAMRQMTKDVEYEIL